ncbi:hypothetical protein NITLEN_20259 [Nitrospira lenta]|uniref:Antitoxin Xre/MbcA/ParS-like toxin-binding domain-containing protein n=2 Tax=Nitrospira lenta TaxID=1436998 RepID=A0A330LC76_9BACT|nr:hypothetical protein NITLEN_20259 [Nitrospira lenta]
MTLGPMQAYSQAVHKYSGRKKLTNKAMLHWLEVVLPTLPPRTQQIFVDELFFLTTGLPPMYADSEPTKTRKSAEKPAGKRKTVKRSAQATQDAFYIQQEAVEAFGTESKANVWLTRPNSRLKNKTPLFLLGTKAGNARVQNLLKQIEHEKQS